MRNLTLLSFFLFIFFLFISTSCDNEESNNNNGHNNHNDTTIKVSGENPLTIVLEEEDGDYILGDNIKINFLVKDISSEDTLQLIINNEEVKQLSSLELSFSWNTSGAKTGTNIIEIELNREGNRFKSKKKVLLYSDLEPEKMTYKLINTYKHDVKAYTQGLFYFDGFLYEATGLKGESTVRKVKLETGEVIQSFAIPTDVFGEGIVLFDNKIIQLSWESGRGFVYDFETFKLLDEFIYEGEGWGLCTDGKYLYMSNGSHQLKVLETDSYSQVKILEVYDNKGLVRYLNEMEFINGYIYANVYQYEKIVKIDPVSGKVLQYIDLKGILPMKEYSGNTDVLNGIAYDPGNDRIFVTGKNWPKLFEIDIIKE